MSRDRYERRHRKTHRNAKAIEMVVSADFSRVPPLAEVLADSAGGVNERETDGAAQREAWP